MRVVVLDGEEKSGKMLFATLYTAFINGEPAKGREQNRIIIKVHDKLDAISHEPNGEEGKRILNEGGGEIYFEDAEFGLLKESVEAFITKAPRGWDRRIEDACTLLDKARVEKAGPKLEVSSPSKAASTESTEGE